MSYKSIHTGPQIDAGVDAALNPDVSVTPDSDALVTSGAVADALDNIDPTITSNTDTTLNGILVGDGGKVGTKSLDTSSLTNDEDHVPVSSVVKSALTGLVSAVDTQAFTKAQKAQARGNIGAESSWTRLWVNASPNNDFPGQTIAISGMENWSEFRICFSEYKTNIVPSVDLVIKGFGDAEQWVFNAARFHFRTSATSADGVAFDDSGTFNQYANTSKQINNGYVIPWCIEGR